MKKQFLVFMAASVVFASCNQQPLTKQEPKVRTTPTTDFITTDSANKMIGSYMASINSPANDSSVLSWSIDMDQLRMYDDSATGNNKIARLQIKLAHKLDYINSGHADQNAGYQSNALTIVVVGLNSLGDYVYFQTNCVIDHSTSCPHNCPSGTGGNPLFTVSRSK